MYISLWADKECVAWGWTDGSVVPSAGHVGMCHRGDPTKSQICAPFKYWQSESHCTISVLSQAWISRIHPHPRHAVLSSYSWDLPVLRHLSSVCTKSLRFHYNLSANFSPSIPVPLCLTSTLWSYSWNSPQKLHLTELRSLFSPHQHKVAPKLNTKHYSAGL